MVAGTSAGVRESMNLFSVLSIGYDLLDKIWLSEKGRNPREVIRSIIPNDKCKVLDMVSYIGKIFFSIT